MMLVGDESGLAQIKFIGDDKDQEYPSDLVENAAFFKEVVAQLKEYLSGVREEFSLKLHPVGTEFQMAVWDELKKIPYAETRSYKDIAAALKKPKAVRAVGMANNKNPLPIVVPCHRVIGKNGKMVGYAGGVGIKEALLSLERLKKF